MSEVRIEDLMPNPFRKMDKYPIDLKKVEALKTSINETSFWDNILARPSPDGNNTYQIAYGHHRLIALQELLKEGKIKFKVDIPVRDLDDATMIRIMANENMDSWGTNSSVIHETVLAAKEFLDAEIAKFSSWEDAKTSDLINSLDLKISREQDFTALKTKGVGQTTILKFLGRNWKQWMIQQALAAIKDEEVEREAIEVFENPSHAYAFREALKNEKSEMVENGKPITKPTFPREEQEELAQKIRGDIEKSGKEPTADEIKKRVRTLANKKREMEGENEDSRITRDPYIDPDTEQAAKLASKLENWADAGLDIIQKLQNMERESDVEGLEDLTSFLTDKKTDVDLKKLKKLSHNFINKSIKKAEEKAGSEYRRRKGSINRLDLLEVLSILNLGLSKEKLFEQDTHYFFMNDRIASHSHYITTTIFCDIGFKCSVNAHEFFKCLSYIPDEWIDIELQEDILVVTSEKTTCEFEYYTEPNPFFADEIHAPDFFGLIEDISADNYPWKKLPHDLIPALTLCSSYASTDPAFGIYTVVFANHDSVIASNAAHALKYDLESPIEDNFLMAPRSIKILKRFDVNSFGPYDLHSYCVDGKWTLFKGENIIIGVPNWPHLEIYWLSGEPNPYEKIISYFSKDEDCTIVKLPKNLAKVLERLSKIQGRELELPLLDREVKLIFSSNELICCAEKVEGPFKNKRTTVKVRESLPLEDGPEDEITILLNPYLFSKGLKDAGNLCYLPMPVTEARTFMLISNNLKYVQAIRESEELKEEVGE